MLESIRTRRSVRRYLPKPVEAEKIQELLKAAFFAPTAKNLRQTEFILIQDRTTAAKLALATAYSALVERAPLVIAICYNTTKARRFQEDCAIAAAHIYLEATAQGLGACYVQIAEGTEAQAGPPEAYVKKLLALPESHRVLCVMAVGYPDAIPAPHRDEEYDALRVHREQFGQ